jgi:GGDEF domain-containing protein
MVDAREKRRRWLVRRHWIERRRHHPGHHRPRARHRSKLRFWPTARFFEKARGSDGLWRALGPDAIWLSAEILGCFARAAEPFARRFRFPHFARANRDHKTGLPFYAYFADLARAFAALGGLASATVELAFLDLVGFRAFSNAFGQDRGDEVLGAFAHALAEIENTVAIRDGGDEFLVLAPPGREPLYSTLDDFRRAWPKRFAERFGPDVPPVAPRILTASGTGRALVTLREELGRRITSLKGVPSGPDGILRDEGAI